MSAPPPPGMTESQMREYARIQAEESARLARLSGLGSGASSKELADFQRESAKFADSLGRLAGGLNQGYQGQSAYNDAIQAGASTFGSLTTLLGPLGKTFDYLGVKAGDYAVLVNKQTDALYKSYQDISSVGATGKEGLQGVFNTMQQFGLGIAQLPQFNAMIKENAESLAGFGGSVKIGLQSFANLSEGVKRTGLQAELMNLGMSEEAISKGLGNFLKTTTQLGNSQRLLSMTTAEQARAAADFIKQQDLVTKLTGANAEQQQKALEQAMSNDRYAAYVSMQQTEMERLRGEGQQEAADKIKEQLATNLAILNSVPESVRGGMQDVLAGVGTLSEDGRKIINTIGNVATEGLQDQNKSYDEKMAGIKAGAEETRKNNDRFVNTVGKTDFLAPFNAIMQMSGRMPSKGKETKEDQADQIKGGIEQTLASYNAMVQEQIGITRKFQDVIQIGMQPLSTAMLSATKFIDNMVGIIPGSSGIARTGTQTYINAKEKKELGETAVIKVRNEKDPWLDKEYLTAIRKDIKDDWTTATGELRKLAKTLGDTFSDWTKKLEKLATGQTSSTTTTPQTANLAAGQVAAMLPISLQTGMASLIADMRRSTGPNNNYNPALTDTVYTPPINREEETARSNATDAVAQYNKDQIMAFATMSGKLDEMIGLLSRSVGIQDKTLRVAYNA